MNDANDLLDRLVSNGGAIVSSNICSDIELSDARARNDFYVNEENLGFVLRPEQWVNKNG